MVEPGLVVQVVFIRFDLGVSQLELHRRQLLGQRRRALLQGLALPQPFRPLPQLFGQIPGVADLQDRLMRLGQAVSDRGEEIELRLQVFGGRRSLRMREHLD